MSLRRVLSVLVAGATALAAATPAAAAGAAPARAVPGAAAAPVDVATGLRLPWSAAHLPDGTLLFTTRGTARIWAVPPGGGQRIVQWMAAHVTTGGERGLLGLAVSPTYDVDRLVYVYYSTATDNRVARMRLGQPPQPILTGIPVANIHNGGRIAFGPDGMLYVATGDAANPANSQNPASLGGKILRVTPTGAPAPGNPLPGSVVWTLGHRNVQGIAWDTAGRMYASELGQATWDEFNRIEAGRNYGWPVVEGVGNDPRFADPLVVWSPADASPSGLAIRGDSAFVACLRGQKLFRVDLDGAGGVVGRPQALFAGQFGRLRHVLVEPSGSLLVLTSNWTGGSPSAPGNDRVIRVDG